MTCFKRVEIFNQEYKMRPSIGIKDAIMFQAQLPIFPSGTTNITKELGFTKENGIVTYFNGNMPVFTHDQSDLKTFRMITSQFCVNGNCKQMDIVRAFGVSKISVKRYVKMYCEKGPAGFYAPRKGRGATVLTPSVLKQAQELLDEGKEASEIAAELNIKKDTLRKAINSNRLHEPLKKSRKSTDRS